MSIVRSICQPIVRPLTRAIGEAGGGGAIAFVSNGVLSSRVTFTRASTGTYFDSAGVMQTAAIDVPRVDYRPSTLALRGLMVEEQRTNIVLRSQELDNATSWTVSNGTITANDATAPDGTVTAEKLVEASGATGNKQVIQSVSVSSGVIYTISAYVKAAERNCILLGFGSATPWGGGAQREASFNLGTASVIASSGGVTATITAASNGWYRCQVVSPVTTAAATPFHVLRLVNAAGSPSYAGVAGSGIHLWGAQFEAGGFASSYIPTAATAQTRSIDDPDFTIPAGIVRLEYTYDDDTTSDVAVTPGASYQIPTGQKRIKHLRGHRS